MNSNTDSDQADRIIQQLEATKKEIELFVGELNLDNTVAEQRYLQLKKEFKSSISEMKELLERKHAFPDNAASELLITLSELEMRLENSEGNAGNEIKELIQGIKKGLNEIASAISTEIPFNEIAEKIHHRLQWYRLKFEVVRLKLTLGALKIKYFSKDAQYQLNLKIQALAKFLRESKEGAEEKMRTVRHMMERIHTAIDKIHSSLN